MTTTTNATATTNPVFETYKAQCQAIQKAGQQQSAKAAYAVQMLILKGETVTPEQQATYDNFVALVKQAEAACMAVKGKATACGIFNYLDGRVTGAKVANALGNSISLRNFMAGMATIAAKVADAALTPFDVTPDTALATPANVPAPTSASKRQSRKGRK